MAQLHSRTGQLDEARRLLARALERTSLRDAEEARLRGQILEQLGDVERAAKNTKEAHKHYTDALSIWDGALKTGVEEMERAFGEIRRGVLLVRLERPTEALDAFELAMQAVPYDRETYAQILSFMVVGAPSLDVATSILQRAQRQLTLDPEWRTYFALWVNVIAGRTRSPAPPEIARLLGRLARSETWWGRLAQFGVGAIDYQQLSGFAKTRGEHVEADFYEGARRLAKGELGQARALFQQVVDSKMVSFFEFQIAQELLLMDDTKLSSATPPPKPAQVLPTRTAQKTAPSSKKAAPKAPK